MTQAFPDTDTDTARLDALYMALERSHGAPDGEWLAEIGAIADGCIDRLADAYTCIPVVERHAGDTAPTLRSAPHLFDEREVAAIRWFFSKATTLQFVRHMLDSAQKHGRIVIDNPLGGEPLWSDTSITGGSVVYLRFRGGTEPVYLVQHNFAVEALFFPLRRCMVYLNDCRSPETKLRRLLLRLLRASPRLLGHLAAEDKRWDGLLVANGSPYHYFYFQAPVIAAAFFDRPEPAPAFHSLATENFLDVPTVFALGEPTRVHDSPNDLNATLVTEHTFVFSIGVRTSKWLSTQRMRMADATILTMARRLHDVELSRAQRSYDLVLWLGISSGKRAWREETDALAELVRHLAAEHARVLVLLDGWTGTGVRRAGPEMYSADEGVVEKLRAEFPANVDCISLVGADAVRKTAWASIVDFFICSQGTASLFVSRIAGRPGVCHISNIARQAAARAHTHPNAVLVPEDMVRDHEPEGGVKDRFKVDYSIDPATFVAFALGEFARFRGTDVPAA